MDKFTTREIAQINDIDIYTKEMNLGGRLNDLIPAMGTPVNGADAKASLSISGVVVDGEQVIVGGDVYQFSAASGVVVMPEGVIPVDIESYTTASTVTLTIAVQPSSGDTMTIAGKEYTFVPVGTANADGEISIESDLATAKAAIIEAINGLDEHNLPNQYVTIGDFSTDDAVITAIVGGTVGDDLAVEETFTGATNVFSAIKLGSGVDCSAANAVTALVAAVTADDTQGISAADGTGNVVDFTVDVAGVAGNNIEVSTVMTNGTFGVGVTNFAGGADGTVGKAGQMMIDATYFYVCIANNDVSGKNWRRLTLGAAF